MSRAGYSDDAENIAMWRGQVASAIRGKRGQAFLREMLEALDAMPEKLLIAEDLRRDGNVCAIGTVGAKRGVDLEALDPYDYEALGRTFGIAYQLVCEIEYVNDERWFLAGQYIPNPTPEQRWQIVRDWVEEQIRRD